MNPDHDQNPFAQFIVDQREINHVAAVCIVAALGLVALLFAVVLL